MSDLRDVKGIVDIEELRRFVDETKWIWPYEELLVLYDPRNNIVLLGENYGPENCCFGDTTRFHNIKEASKDIVLDSYLSGTWTFYMVKPGIEAKLKLIPSFAPAGIESVMLQQDKQINKQTDEQADKQIDKQANRQADKHASHTNNKAVVTYAGLGGYGVSASYSRGVAKGVEAVEIFEAGGGERLGRAGFTLHTYHLLTFGVDDTDNHDTGATYALVKRIGVDLQTSARMQYGEPVVKLLFAPEVQLYPFAPDKTKNCFASGVSFGVRDGVDGLDDFLVANFVKQLKEYTSSPNTGLIIYSGVWITEEMMAYSDRARREIIDLEDACHNAFKTLEQQGFMFHEITGSKGLIGAAAVPGMLYWPDEAGKVLPEHRRRFIAKGDPRK
ncbi:hypothetical protein HY636_03595 [Candidatus Woesearchaeota archaeon]|nr:hypothetical protein [Candidatus Woesearchaeota archaeon]